MSISSVLESNGYIAEAQNDILGKVGKSCGSDNYPTPAIVAQ